MEQRGRKVIDQGAGSSINRSVDRQGYKTLRISRNTGNQAAGSGKHYEALYLYSPSCVEGAFSMLVSLERQLVREEIVLDKSRTWAVYSSRDPKKRW